MTGSYLSICYEGFLISYNKRGQEVHKNYINNFAKKKKNNLVKQIVNFGSKNDISF